MRDIAISSFKLFLITAVAALALAFTNSITSERIAQQAALENELAREEVISPSDEFQQVEQREILKVEEELGFENPEIVSEVYEDIVDGQVYGYTFKVLPRGYGGEITLMVGISVEGEITGLEVISHSETPGLGANVTNSSFLEQFKGKSVEELLTVVKGDVSGDDEVQALTGATITSNAVVDGVNIAVELFNKINN